MKKGLIIHTLLLCFLFSCNENSKPTDGNLKEDVKQNLKISNNDADFDSFWKEFRKGIIDLSQVDINHLIKVPLKINGYEDSDPILTVYNNDSIMNFFNSFLDEPTVNYENFSTHKDFIDKMENIENYKSTVSTDNWRRIENMEFEKTGNGWKLVLVYMNTRQM